MNEIGAAAVLLVFVGAVCAVFEKIISLPGWIVSLPFIAAITFVDWWNWDRWGHGVEHWPAGLLWFNLIAWGTLVWAATARNDRIRR